MELKSLQDWVITKYMKSVPDVVDDSSFGGITREYQIRVDPDKLVSYGLSLAQVEQQLTNANANAGGSFIEQGAQQINVRAVGLVRNVNDIEKTVLKTQNGHRPPHEGHCGGHAGAEDSPGPDRKSHSSVRRRGGRRQRRGGRHRVHAQRGGHGDDDGRHPRHGAAAERPHPASGSEDRSLPGSRRSGALHDAHRPAQPRPRE